MQTKKIVFYVFAAFALSSLAVMVVGEFLMWDPPMITSAASDKLWEYTMGTLAVTGPPAWWLWPA